MIVGDIGYGLVFTVTYWYLTRYIKRNKPLVLDFFKLQIPPGGVAQILAVLKPMIIWTFVWGFLYGEFFGDFLYRLGVFGTARQPGLIPILIPRTDTVATANTLILVSVGFGVYQVLYGFYLKASRNRRWGEKKHFWEASGYFSGVSALVMFSYAFMTGTYRPWLIIPVAIGTLIFLAGMIMARTPLMIAELPTQGGHILSYIRIYAVGLASAILANLTTSMGFSLYHLLGVAGLFVGVVVGTLLALLIHAVLLVLLTVSHVLQPIRLIWVEFFTKFDFYTVSGRPYRPFRVIGSQQSEKQ
jgi:V/A-type H+-transporting ATPase subunit I